jgi:predicted ABC-type ATPase
MISLKKLLETVLVESSRDKGIFKAIFTAGIPGSGKSYVLDKINDGNIMPRIVNTDKFVEYISSLVGHDINSAEYYDLFVDRIKLLTKNQFALYLNGGLPLFVDGTSNSAKSLFKRDGILKSFGYDTGMVWINTDLDTAIERAKKRERQVPEDFIREVFDKLNKNKEYYRSHFKFFLEVNNSDGELDNKVILNAYRACGNFFSSPISNPIGIENKERMEKANGFMVPAVYNSIEDIQRQVHRCTA